MAKECSLTQNVLLDLLKISLWDVSPNIDYGNLSGEEWLEVYRLSGKQGVRSLAFGGVSRLPESMQPDEKLLLSWAANTALAKEKSLRNMEIVSQLDTLFAAEGMELLLLKGCALADCYPIPEYREYGDIDIYLFGNHSKGDSLLRKQGIPVKEVEKHSAFIFQGILVENHKMFIDLIGDSDIFCKKRKEAFQFMEWILHEILKEDKKQYLDRYSIRVPSATFNFLFMIMHTGSHLGKELVVRHVCDWACFLAANKGKYNERRIEQALDKMNFKLLCLMMTDIAIRYIGMPAEFAPSFYKKGDREQINAKFVNSLFRHFPGAKEIEKNTLYCRWQRFYHNQWVYDLFKKEYLPERLCRTIIVWFKKKCKNKLLVKQ